MHGQPKQRAEASARALPRMQFQDRGALPRRAVRLGRREPESGFDTSALHVMYVYAQLGVSLPHYTVSQYCYRKAVHVPRSKLAPGDLVFFSDHSHVGIYMVGFCWQTLLLPSLPYGHSSMIVAMIVLPLLLIWTQAPQLFLVLKPLVPGIAAK